METEPKRTIWQWSQYYLKKYIILNCHTQFSELPSFSNLTLQNPQ